MARKIQTTKPPTIEQKIDEVMENLQVRGFRAFAVVNGKSEVFGNVHSFAEARERVSQLLHGQVGGGSCVTA